MSSVIIYLIPCGWRAEWSSVAFMKVRSKTVTQHSAKQQNGINNNNKTHKTAPYRSFVTIKISRSLDFIWKAIIYTLNAWSSWRTHVGRDASSRFRLSSYSEDVKKGVNNIFSNQFGISELGEMGDTERHWASCTEPFYVFKSRVFQLFRRKTQSRMSKQFKFALNFARNDLQSCFTCTRLKFFVFL